MTDRDPFAALHSEAEPSNFQLGQMLGAVNAKVDILVADRPRLNALERNIWYARGAIAIACVTLWPHVKTLLGV